MWTHEPIDFCKKWDKSKGLNSLIGSKDTQPNNQHEDRMHVEYVLDLIPQKNVHLMFQEQINRQHDAGGLLARGTIRMLHKTVCISIDGFKSVMLIML